ncbi:MAG: hypothetical protein MI922_29600 [Bacteroidales bacterium]|nr:hypothetical protein [Bacteroidales bacterium]
MIDKSILKSNSHVADATYSYFSANNIETESSVQPMVPLSESMAQIHNNSELKQLDLNADKDIIVSPNLSATGILPYQENLKP